MNPTDPRPLVEKARAKLNGYLALRADWRRDGSGASDLNRVEEEIIGLIAAALAVEPAPMGTRVLLRCSCRREWSVDLSRLNARTRCLDCNSVDWKVLASPTAAGGVTGAEERGSAPPTGPSDPDADDLEEAYREAGLLPPNWRAAAAEQPRTVGSRGQLDALVSEAWKNSRISNERDWSAWLRVQINRLLAAAPEAIPAPPAEVSEPFRRGYTAAIDAVLALFDGESTTPQGET